MIAQWKNKYMRAICLCRFWNHSNKSFFRFQHCSINIFYSIIWISDAFNSNSILLNVYNTLYGGQRMVCGLFLSFFSVSVDIYSCLFILQEYVCQFQILCWCEKIYRWSLCSVKDGSLKQIMENHFFTGTFTENHCTLPWQQRHRIFLLYFSTCSLRVELGIRNYWNLVFRWRKTHFSYWL